MTPTPLRTAAVLGVLGVLLVGCSAATDQSAESAAASMPASAAPSASPSSTLTPEEQQAVDEAAAVVLAYEQMFYDLLADPSRPLNDINDVVTEPQLARDLVNLGRQVEAANAGSLVVESTGPVSLVSVEPIAITLDGDPHSVSLNVCVDQSQASGTDGGRPWRGGRERLRYELVRTAYLPAPGWAVAEVLPPDGYDQPQPC